MDTSRTVHVVIEGRVQGVGYRAWLEVTAQALTLTGWVRNHRDGSVETVLQGPPEEISEMLCRCEVGPPAACVSHLEVLGEEGDVYDGFEVRPSA